MKHFTFLIILFFIISCDSKTHDKKVKFDYLEMTYSNGWTGGYSLSIDSNNILRHCNWSLDSSKNKKCFCDTLDENVVASVNYYFDKVELKNKINNYTSTGLVDADYAYLIIKKGKIKYQFYVNNLTNKDTLKFVKLMRYLTKCGKKIKNNAKDIYKFKETYDSVFIDRIVIEPKV